MKAAVLTAAYHIEFQDVPEPEPGPGEVKIKVVSAGICGSELHAFKGTHPFRHPPSILGHEMAGDIVAVGPGVLPVLRQHGQEAAGPAALADGVIVGEAGILAAAPGTKEGAAVILYPYRPPTA